MSDEKLKRCGHCGGLAAASQDYRDHLAFCSLCEMSTRTYGTAEEAAEAWNRRAIDPDAVRLDQLVRERDYAQDLHRAARDEIARLRLLVDEIHDQIADSKYDCHCSECNQYDAEKETR